MCEIWATLTAPVGQPEDNIADVNNIIITINFCAIEAVKRSDTCYCTVPTDKAPGLGTPVPSFSASNRVYPKVKLKSAGSAKDTVHWWPNCHCPSLTLLEKRTLNSNNGIQYGACQRGRGMGKVNKVSASDSRVSFSSAFIQPSSLLAFHALITHYDEYWPK